MRVLHILKITRVAGVERQLLTLCQGLRKEGVDARLLFLVERRRPMTEYVAECERRGIPSQRMIIYHDADPSLPARLSRAIRKQQPDIAHLHLIHAEIHGNLAARSAGVPQIFVSRHNQDAFRERPPLRALLRRLWKRVDLAIVIAEHLREEVHETEGVPPAKIRRIYYGLEAPPPSQPPDLRAELGIPPAALLVGAVCRLMPQKGLSDGLAAFARGAPANAHLAIIGDGPLRGPLESAGRRFALLRARTFSRLAAGRGPMPRGAGCPPHAEPLGGFRTGAVGSVCGRAAHPRLERGRHRGSCH